MRRWFALPLLLMTAPAPGQQIAATADPTAMPASGDPAVVDAWLQALGNSNQRMTVPVSIGERGPYSFVIDTGAERTIIARELARRLSLGPGQPVRVTSMTGTSDVGTVVVPGLSVSRLTRSQVEAPAFGGIDLGAPGMLGVDSLQGHAVSIDFKRNVMAVTPVKRRRLAVRSAPDEVVIRAQNIFGQLIVTDADYRGHRIYVIIDTGSPVTVGNAALLKLMRKPPRALGPIGIVSATGDTLAADYRMVDRLTIGGIGFVGLPVAFADAAPFRRFQLEDKPAMLLGMSTMRMFRNVQIDFVSRQIRFRMPPNGTTAGPGVSGV